jgi:bla regulator protein BlaR1
MTILVASNASMSSALVNHLWQSTAFAAIAWLLTLALLKYPARVRFSVWMLASIKFLIPFALLTSLGAHWARPNPQHQVHVVFYTVIQEFSQPFVAGHATAAGPAALGHSVDIRSSGFVLLATLWLCGCLVMVVRWTLQWMSARRVINDAAPVDEGREVLALRRVEAEARSRKPIAIVITSRALEPGIFGVIRPVLLWPERLSEQLDDLQIEAIVAHELEHVRRRDNLISAVHALVEALFWFHPAVHWMGSKMSEERERTCDERVIEQSAHPEKYAQSILTVCAFCLESPLPCVAGVSGSDLKKRILRIMTHRSGVALTIGKRALLAAAAILVITLPIGFGVLRGQAGPVSNSGGPDSEEHRDLPKYDVSSVKPASSNDGRSVLQLTPDGTSIHGIPVQMLLRFAFGVEADRMIGAPSWAQSNRYDIEAKVAPEDAPKLDKLKAEDRRAMLLPLLVERFNLKYHHETREMPMYTLVVAKGGPKLIESKPAPSPDDPPGVQGAPKPMNMAGRMMMMPGRIESQGSTLDMLAHSLSPQLGHTVVDKTGLTGKYDYTLQWTPDEGMTPMTGGAGGGPPHEDNAAQAGGPSLFTAVEEQLGLKIESTKGQVDVIVIDHLDLPSAN